MTPDVYDLYGDLSVSERISVKAADLMNSTALGWMSFEAGRAGLQMIAVKPPFMIHYM